MRIEASIDQGRAKLAKDFVESRLKRSWEDLTLQQKVQTIYNLQRGCKCCELYLSKYKPVPSILTPGCKYLFIGRAPNESEAQQSHLYPKTTQQGQCLDAYLRTLGIGLGECSFLNMCQCWSPGATTLTSEHVSVCSFFKALELEVIGDNFTDVFLLGDTAIHWVFGLNSPGLRSAHGVSLKATWLGKERHFHLLYHPSYLVIRSELRSDIGHALKAISKLIHKTQTKEEAK